LHDIIITIGAIARNLPEGNYNSGWSWLCGWNRIA